MQFLLVYQIRLFSDFVKRIIYYTGSLNSMQKYFRNTSCQNLRFARTSKHHVGMPDLAPTIARFHWAPFDFVSPSSMHVRKFVSAKLK